MAIETLEANKTQEPDSPLKTENGVTDSVTVTERKESKGEEAKTVSPMSERPTRERKKTARYITPTSPPSSVTKPASIQQGRGTQLKEIPNVAYKLSKRKPDDNLFLLHTILYGKKGKVQMLKRNIGQFSGFVWSEEEEEKQRARAKEKLEKCIKEKLIDFCDVLDIPINKSTVKKEELAVKVLEFLVSPKATRDVVLAESEKETKKRKKSTPTSGESTDTPAKKRRESKKSGKKQDQPSETEEENEDGDVGSKETNDSCGKDDGAPEEVNEDTETKDKKNKAEEKKSIDKKSLSKRTKKEKPAPEEEKSLKGPAKSGRSSSKQVEKSTSSSNKKQKTDNDDSSKEKGKKQTSKPHAKGSKDQGKASNKAKTQPTRKQLHAVVVNVLKEVDFDTATLSDILRKLGIHFGVDLMHRKNEVKDIITDALDEMSDDDDDDDGDETTA